MLLSDAIQKASVEIYEAVIAILDVCSALRSKNPEPLEPE